MAVVVVVLAAAVADMVEAVAVAVVAVAAIVETVVVAIEEIAATAGNLRPAHSVGGANPSRRRFSTYLIHV